MFGLFEAQDPNYEIDLGLTASTERKIDPIISPAENDKRTLSLYNPEILAHFHCKLLLKTQVQRCRKFWELSVEIL